MNGVRDLNVKGHAEDSEMKSLKKKKERHTNRSESFTIVPPEQMSIELGGIYNKIEAVVSRYS